MQKPKRDWLVALGMFVSAVSAGFSSFAGLKSLAEATGWAGKAPLFALCVDAYALTAIRVWLTKAGGNDRVRDFARWNAIGAIALSLAGNATWHLIAAHLIVVTWPVVMTVGAVPPVVLGLVSHLAVLRTQVEPVQVAAVEAVVVPVQPPEGEVRTPHPPSSEAVRPPREVPATPGELLIAARAADTAYRASHDGRPISRDALRLALKIGAAKASALIKELRPGGAAHQAPDTSGDA